MALDTLRVKQHYRAASTYGTSSEDSVETPHDNVHLGCAFPMESLRFAAHHPLFWLHHCNVDRFYEAYLGYHPDSQREYESNQELGRHVNTKRNNRDRYDAWLEPFYLPPVAAGGRTDVQFLPEHTFSTTVLGYQYDATPLQPPQALTEPPICALFPKINAGALPSSYAVYVYVYDASGGTTPEPPLGPDTQAMLQHPAFAGWGALFTGTADECENCASGDLFDLRIKINNAVRALDVPLAQVALKVVVKSDADEWLPLRSTPIPPPQIRGGGAPFTPRFDLHPDAASGGSDAASAAASSAAAETDQPTFAPGSTVRYYIEASPGYLGRAGVVHELSQMFTEWAGPRASGLTFERVGREQQDSAQLVIGWADHSDSNPSLFDGPGGKLAECSTDAKAQRALILFDASGDYSRGATIERQPHPLLPPPRAVLY